MKSENSGIKVYNENISCLAYADDIVILADTPNKLNNLLKILERWCTNWALEINTNKSQIVHFRPKKVNITNHAFSINDIELEKVSTYRYLGVLFDEFLTFETAVNTLSTAAGRALGSVCTKFKVMNEMGFTTYETLYNNCVTPVLDYGSEIWGTKHFSKADSIQNRAMRFYLGVHRFAPNLAVQGDIGWLSCSSRWSINIIRYWNRLINMHENRLTRRVFNWDFSICRNNWSHKVKALLINLNLVTSFHNQITCDLNEVTQKLYD